MLSLNGSPISRGYVNVGQATKFLESVAPLATWFFNLSICQSCQLASVKLLQQREFASLVSSVFAALPLFVSSAVVACSFWAMILAVTTASNKHIASNHVLLYCLFHQSATAGGAPLEVSDVMLLDHMCAGADAIYSNDYRQLYHRRFWWR